jgi:PEP-CTERM motif
MKISLAIALIVVSLFLSVVARAQTVINFDDLSGGAIPNGYAGLQWNNFQALTTQLSYGQFGASPYNYTSVSYPNIAFNNNGAPASFSSSQPFNFMSTYVSGIWNNGMQVEIQGFEGTQLAYDNTFTVYAADPLLETLNYSGVTQVSFISSGGNPIRPPDEGGGLQFAMDNVTIEFVPEPSSWVLSLPGMGVIGYMLVRRSQGRLKPPRRIASPSAPKRSP